MFVSTFLQGDMIVSLKLRPLKKFSWDNFFNQVPTSGEKQQKNNQLEQSKLKAKTCNCANRSLRTGSRLRGANLSVGVKRRQRGASSALHTSLRFAPTDKFAVLL